MKKYKLIFCLIFGLMSGSIIHSQTTMTFSANKDATIFSENQTGSNGAGSLFAGRTNQPATANRRALIRFDISGIPSDATITSAEFSVRGSMQSGTVNVHRLNADWGEGSTSGQGSGGGQPSTGQNGDATWSSNMLGSSTWNSSGGDFVAQSRGSANVSSGSRATWSSNAIVGDVQAWVDGTTDNFGWILIGNESSNNTAVRMNSRSNGANGPMLEVTYMVADACNVDGGNLTGGPFEFCVGDGQADNIAPNGINLSGNSGDNSQWVVTNASGMILGLPNNFTDTNFDGAGAGICLVRHLSYEDGLTGLSIGANVNNLNGCFDLSNSVTVNRSEADGGTLTGGPFTFCVGDGQADNIAANGINRTGNSGDNSQWVVTDANGMILGLPNNFTDTNFDGAGAGTCLVWHLSHADGLTGLTVGANKDNVQGCFDYSNSITVNRNQPEGGTLTGGPFEFCVGDGQADNISANGISLSGNSGGNSQWVVTNDQGTILGLPPNFTDVNFDGAGAGTCLVWHLSHADGLTGLTVGANKDNVQGCFDYSNSITVNRNQPEGGTLTGGPFEFCVGDGQADNISANGISLSGNSGGNSQWVVTNDQGTILGLPPNFTDVNFDGAGAGTCFVYHLSYEDGLTGLTADANISNLQGCFDLSNAVTVNRNQPDGGSLTGGPFEFCVGNGVPDLISANAITLSGNSGGNSQWVVTNETGMILGLPPNFTQVNFDGAGAGTCFVYHLSYEDGLTGLAADANISDLQGCFDLSNAVTVNRNQPDGGSLTGGPFEFCVGNGEADNIGANGISLSGNSGGNSQWVVTNETGMILGLPPNFTDVNFDGAGAGTCFVYHLSYEDGLTGLAADANISDLQGCFDLSNAVTVNRVTSGGVCPEEMIFVSTLAGTQSVPAFNSPGSGTVTGVLTGNSLAVSGTFMGLAGDFAASHIHMAPAGRTGGVIFPLTETLDADLRGGSYAAADNTFELSDEQVQTLKDRYYYVNIHTMALGSGEIRGQLLPMSEKYLATSLKGANENPPAASTGTGNVVLEITGNTLIATGGFNDLVGDFAMQIAGGSHIHTADAANNGGITFGLTVDLDDDLKGGKYKAADNTFTITDDEKASLMNGGTYVNIHTSEVNSGELRGQVLNIDNAFPAGGFGITSPADGAEIEVSSDPNANVEVTWDATTDPNNDLLVYTWQAALDPAFNVVVFQQKVGVATSLTLPQDVIDGLLAPVLPIGQSITIFHRAVASDGSVCTEGEASSLTVTRVAPPEEMTFVSTLAGTQSVPAFNSPGSGTVTGVLTGNSLAVSGTFMGLAGDFAASHIHMAPAGRTGGVIFPLTETLDADLRGGSYAAADNTFELSDEQVQTLKDRYYYVNIHTMALGSGEIRGQLLPMSEKYLATSLKGANENPPAASTGTGNVVLEITGNTLIATGGFNDLVGDFAMQIAGGSHIHTADAANNGGITFGLTVDLDDDLKGGKYKAADNTFTITDDEKASLMNGGTYVNIHTSEVNSGELRGQVLNIDNAFPAGGFGITSLADGAEIEVSSDPNANVEVTWDATTDPNNDLLVYTWQAALDPAFSVVVFQQKVGVATSLTLPQDVIDGLLAPVLPIGQSITIFHRAVASDGSVCTEGEASSLTVTRVAVCDPDGGILTGGPFEFCVDGNVDNASGINLSGVMGSNQAWIITDDQGNILALPDNPSDVNFDNAGVGICFIYNISYEDGLTGLEAGNNIDQLDGCFDLSNPITVVRTDEGTICEPVDCAAPTSIVVELLSSRSFSVTWDKVDDARAYFIRIRFAGQEKYLIRARVRNTRVLVFGPSNRSYEIQIQTECSDGSLSPYTDIIPVSTAKSILAPTDDFRDGDIEILEVFEDSFEGLSVRPNPVADILSITYIGKEESEVILYAMDGRAIDRKKFNQGVINHRINVEALQSGVYILQVISESGTVQNERIVKMRR